MRVYAGKVLMLLENTFLKDPRVRKEAFKLREEGYAVRVISLTESSKKIIREDIKGIICYRIPGVSFFRKSSGSESYLRKILFRMSSALGYILEYIYFTTACFLIAPYVAIRDGFDVIHVHNPPNTLSLVAIFYKLLGKLFVFDHHDLEPELFLSRYRLKDSLIYKILIALEKVSLKFANLVIATNQSYKSIEMKRARIGSEKIHIVRNGPETDNLKPVQPDYKIKKMNKTILVYVGVMGPQDGVDYLLRALWHLANTLNRTNFYCLIIGRGDALPVLKNLCSELKLDSFVRFTGYISKNTLIRYLSTADICLDPNPSSPLNDYSTWIKVMEYMAFGKSIVSFDLKETRYTAQRAAIYVKPNDEKEYAQAILCLMADPDRREKMGKFGMQRIEKELSWGVVSKNLIAAYEWLFNGSLISNQ